MGFGVLSNASDPFPRGTTLLSAQNTSKDAKSHIILVPQPSQSPNDPLNLSKVRKELLFLTIVLGASAAGVIGPLLVPGFGLIAQYFGITLTQVTLLNGSLVMALGVSSYLCSCFAEVYGKRLVYLFTTLLLVVTCCWGAAAQSYQSLLAARVFQGLGMGGFFALAGTSSINDVFFVHQRGFRVGLWNFAVIVSVNIATIISGQVIVNLSWRWAFGLLAIFFGVVFLFVIFCFPETAFDRDTQRSMSVTSIKQGTESGHGIVHAGEKESPDVEQDYSSTTVGTVTHVPTFWSRVLGLNNFQIHDQSRLPKLLVSPFLLLRHPAVVWGCCMWAVTFTWVIIQGAVASQIFAAPPYNLAPTSVGNLIGIAPLVGSALGTFLGGWSCDVIAKLMAARNDGVYEPEFRLLVIVPSLLSIIIGGFGLGVAVEKGLSVLVCAVFLAFINFAVGVACTGIVAYTNDVCQQKAGESFGLAMLIKSAFAFGLTFMLNDYYAMHGPRVFFFTWTALTVGVMFTTLPLYVFGKKIRGWSDRKQII